MRRAVIFCFTLSAFRGVWADPPKQTNVNKVLVCYTVGSVAAKDAKPAVEKMVHVIERLAHWEEGTWSGIFTDDFQKCNALMASEKPKLVIPPLGLYLRQRKEKGLVPISIPLIHGQSSETFRLVVRKGTFRSVEEMRGAKIGGTLLEDVLFLKKVVFRDRLDPAQHFQLQPSKVALKPLRELASGKLDGVLLNEQQFRALGGLPFAKDLEVVFQSEPIPVPGVFAVSGQTTEEERKRIQRALGGFCEDKEGRSFCELFGIDGFVRADESSFAGVEALWDGR